MTPLCQRMIEDLQLRGLSVRTQESMSGLYASWPTMTTHPLTGSRRKHYVTPSSLSRTTSTLRALPVPSRCAVSRSSTNIPSSGNGPR